MDVQTKNKINRLNAEIKRSLSNFKVTSSKKITYSEKSKLKKAAKKGIGNFLKKEIRRNKGKAFDWYFDRTIGRLYRQRNGTHKNRYFVVEFTEEINLSSQSSTHNQRVREIFTTDVEFSQIVSSSDRIFAKLYDLTVDVEEKRKIWKSYDSVDEKTIFAVTIGIPLAIIFIAEIAPVAAVEAELLSSATHTVWKEAVVSSITTTSVLETSAYAGLVNGGTNLMGQYVTNDFMLDQNINWAQPIFAGTTRGLFSNIGESAIEVKFYYDDQGDFQSEFNLSDESTFYSTFFSNILGNEVSRGFDGFVKPVNDFTPSFKSTFDIIGGTIIEAGENKVGEKINSTIE